MTDAELIRIKSELRSLTREIRQLQTASSKRQVMQADLDMNGHRIIRCAPSQDERDVTTSDQVGDGDLASLDTVGTGQIDNNAVTFAKMENLSAETVMGRGQGGGTGDPEEITLGTNLSMSGTTLNATGGGGGASELSDLSDVNTSTPTDRNFLVADGTDWESQAVSVDLMNDVDTTTSAPSNNAVLKWNGSDWVPGDTNDATEFDFLIIANAFDDGISGTQEIGSGTWKATSTLTFECKDGASSGYQNGPADSGTVTISSSFSSPGVTWASGGLDLGVGTAFEGPTVQAADTTAYPTPIVANPNHGTITFTLAATNGAENDSQTEVVTFGNGFFYGNTEETVAANLDEDSIDDTAGAETRIKLVTTTKNRTINITTTSTGHIIICYPAREGLATLTSGGFPLAVQALQVISYTNQNGYVEDYNCYLSVQAGLGDGGAANVIVS